MLTTEETALVVRRLEQAERMPGILGAQSQIERDDKRYSVLGDAIIYNGSHRTAHVDYLIVRS